MRSSTIARRSLYGHNGSLTPYDLVACPGHLDCRYDGKEGRVDDVMCRSRVDAWLQAMRLSPDELQHDDSLLQHDTKPDGDVVLCPVTPVGPGPGHTVTTDSRTWIDTASEPCVEAGTPAEVMPVLLEQMACLQDMSWQVPELQSMFRHDTALALFRQMDFPKQYCICARFSLVCCGGRLRF